MSVVVRVGGDVQPEDVFTPRGELKHPDMYIPRVDLERAVMRSLASPKHMVIHGESGSGKSWLYKKVLSDSKIHFEVVNLGRAPALGSISAVMSSILARNNWIEKKEVVDSKGAGVDLKLFNAGLNSEAVYEVARPDIFESCLSLVAGRAPGRKTCLVFDNLESIYRNENLLQELAGYILLVDDDNYSKYGVKVVLVGTPNDIRSCLSRVANSETIKNRLSEVPEVSRLPRDKAFEWVNKGFYGKLGYRFASGSRPGFDRDKLTSEILYYSDLIPQYLQDLCLAVALRAKDGSGVLGFSSYDLGRHDWIRESLIAENVVVESHIDRRRIGISRRNQVMYSLGVFPDYDFGSLDIEPILRAEFPNSCKGVGKVNVSSALRSLSSGSSPLIRRSPNGKDYRFSDPKLKIVLRWKIRKAPSESLHFLSFDSGINIGGPDEG